MSSGENRTFTSVHRTHGQPYGLERVRALTVYRLFNHRSMQTIESVLVRARPGQEKGRAVAYTAGRVKGRATGKAPPVDQQT